MQGRQKKITKHLLIIWVGAFPSDFCVAPEQPWLPKWDSLKELVSILPSASLTGYGSYRRAPSRGFLLSFMQPCLHTHLYFLSIICGHLPRTTTICFIFACLGDQSICFFLVYWDSNNVYLYMGSPSRFVEGREAPLRSTHNPLGNSVSVLFWICGSTNPCQSLTFNLGCSRRCLNGKGLFDGVYRSREKFWNCAC